MRCYLFTSIAALAFFAALGEVASEPKITAYYESLCPDSKRWINTQLLPTYTALGDSFSITLVPFGKASYSKTSNLHSPWHFTCQHGPAECQGNMAQACAINAIEKSEPREKVQQLTVEVVGCAMQSQNTPTAVPKCAEELPMSQQTKDAINQCINNPRMSQELLAKNGEETGALSPRLSFVPTITANGLYTQEIQDKAFSNFRQLVCDLFSDAEKPANCSATPVSS